jgi:radical SAM superfamily enzyme YgiQ (UPF0313 family)
MRLYLINPCNPAISLVNVNANPLNKWRIWKPLGLLSLAAHTPCEWEVAVIDENMHVPDYATLPRPDLVGLTAFTAQAPRAYEIASMFRSNGVGVVMGGIHATMRRQEAAEYVDAVVTGEAEQIWPIVLADAKRGELKREYCGHAVDMELVPIARHSLLPTGYIFGSVQTTRGCPLDCEFCSVGAFNGRRYRMRPIDHVIEELRTIKEKYLLIVDDNLIGTSTEHIARAKDLFRAIIDARIRKRWIAQVTINMADDEELLRLAAESGCTGVFIGFESPNPEGLLELNKKFNLRHGPDFAGSCRRIQRHGISVCASFIMGLDVDGAGIGKRISDAATYYGVDLLNLMFMTPLPGTRLWDKMESEGRIAAHVFPEDWKLYTLTLPVATFRHLSWADMFREFDSYWRAFYSYRQIFRRCLAALWRPHGIFEFWSALISNLIFHFDIKLELKAARGFETTRGHSLEERRAAAKPN